MSWQNESWEEEPSLELTFDDGESLLATPKNTTMYTFLGKTSVGGMDFENSNVNHVFVGVEDEEEGGVVGGIYVFEAFSTGYKDLTDFIIRHDFPMLLNLRDVPVCDLNAYLKEVDRVAQDFATDIPDFVPEN